MTFANYLFNYYKEDLYNFLKNTDEAFLMAAKDLVHYLKNICSYYYCTAILNCS